MSAVTSKKLLCFSFRYKTRMPKQRSTRNQTTWSRGNGTDTSSAKQRPTHGIPTCSYGSRSNSSSARGSQGTSLTRDNISVLIQEVVQLLTKRSALRHSERLSMENTLDDTAPSTPFVNNTLTTDDRALSEDHHTLKSIPRPLDQSLTSELFVTYIVG